MNGLQSLFTDPLPLAFWLPATFALGAIVGSFLNSCIYRLPLEKSVLWPARSYCGSCYQPIKGYDNVPLLSYWLLRGRCRSCGARYSVRYFLVELFTALCVAGLFYLEVYRNIHGFEPRVLGAERFLAARLVAFGFHGVLLCYLIVATFCDIDHQVIPLPLTVSGTVVGLAGALLWPWPWPYTPAQAVQAPAYAGRQLAWSAPWVEIKMGLYPWPAWGPLPAWFGEGGNWRTGLATGLAGLLMGTLILRSVRLLFGIGMGAEYMDEPDEEDDEEQRWFAQRWLSWVQRIGGRALGLGDADLMMMAGSFLGWQPVLVAFFLGIVPGLIFGLAYVVFRRTHTLPFGPALAVGVVLALLDWPRLAPPLKLFFFDPLILLFLAAFCLVAMPIAGYLVHIKRLLGTQRSGREP